MSIIIRCEQVQNTSNDSFELYYGLFMYNPNATEEVRKHTLSRQTELLVKHHIHAAVVKM